MESSSPLKTLRETFSLVYKIVCTLAAGALIVALATACLHFRAVHVGLQQAEQEAAQGQFDQAYSRAARLEPWARCFPGRYRLCALIQIRCLARLNQPEAAARLAEAMRTQSDLPVPRGTGSEFVSTPLVWLQKTSLSLVSGALNAFYPVLQVNEWAGYGTLLDELVATRNAEGLNALADNLITRFPRSSIAVLANSAKGELQPDAPPDSAPHPSAPPPAETPESGISSILESASSDPEPALSAPPPSWGIVTNAGAMALNPENGKPIRPLKIGDVLAIEGRFPLPDRVAFTGTLILNNRNVPDLAFLASDLEIRNGAFATVSPHEVALRSRLAEIQAEEAMLLPKVTRELANLGPEQTAYRQAQAALDAFQREASALNTQAEKATGPERMAILDKLRLMKYRQQTLIQDLQTRKETADLASRKAGRISFEPQLTALRQEKKAILKRLAEPGS